MSPPVCACCSWWLFLGGGGGRGGGGAGLCLPCMCFATWSAPLAYTWHICRLTGPHLINSESLPDCEKRCLQLVLTRDQVYCYKNQSFLLLTLWEQTGCTNGWTTSFLPSFRLTSAFPRKVWQGSDAFSKERPTKVTVTPGFYLRITTSRDLLTITQRWRLRC